MIDLVAKRYVKALLDGRDIDSITALSKELREISSAYNDAKFIAIISSTEVKNNDKVELIISLVDNCSDTLQNLIKLLSNNKRLDIIPVIADELEAQLAVMNNSYNGVIYTNKELAAEYISSIEKEFSKKFNVDLSLSQNICDYNGIKVDIDGLGVEISFSKDRLKSQMIDHILKAV
ncbi:F0F1 ATP synthase subunit delta [Malaciobacter marinus]|uniref:ATP synthase subunit delta n=1 Tax=Malaciobacter marinus TaxID=505249 RepID=A0A347TMD0_9BACT|nr:MULTISPECIES: F0F1 ATP synthase subunit delta [Malaciobacter]AXX87758.1 ATP synthase, F1 complex, delta subunit [Malaciobacter marinus]PHO12440.1 F0F1 ATP synthase subunit delta [Malaciobacter marinus]PHO16550.1 F0F1 ATP synthase subunit delta [Malaciobacter marinus]RYA22951.1 F0F1 ATP synthase subunit delta [Malaciobacter halophilus]